MAENSTLRRQFFIVLFRELFRYNEEHFLMNKTYYKDIPEKWDQDPRVRPRTLGWNPGIGP